MKTLQQQLDNLAERFMFASSPDTNTIFDHSKDVAIKLRTQLFSSEEAKAYGGMCVQVIIAVVTEDAVVWSYGAANEKDNQRIIDWFKFHRIRLTSEYHNQRDANIQSVKRALNL